MMVEITTPLNRGFIIFLRNRLIKDARRRIRSHGFTWREFRCFERSLRHLAHIYNKDREALRFNIWHKALLRENRTYASFFTLEEINRASTLQMEDPDFVPICNVLPATLSILKELS